MASAGPSRCRAPAQSSVAQDDDEPRSTPTTTQESSDSSAGNDFGNGSGGGGGSTHAGPAFANGSRITDDPRDLALSSSEDALVGKLPKLARGCTKPVVHEHCETPHI
ncbi:hypothetical protein MSAN_01591700 [Mycena sanguinolenta]|uniref:Uncharacterized protein n=1 Tax=Mycena sanguinolenta TaxID=230812 RepID=A0A8H6Y4F0_9AGAR|nr:hypothetical protein MSAN_01591700 [Mycena sanguinolenta]